MLLCKYCGASKPPSEFNLNSNGMPRRSCKACHKAKYYTYEKKPASYWAAKKAATQAAAEYARFARSFIRNAVKELTSYANAEELAQAKKDAKRKKKKAYRARNPIEKIVRRHNWKARKRGVEGCISVTGLRRLIAAQGLKCNLCGVDLVQGENLNVDHVIPKSKGGSNTDDNIQLLCAACNSKKGVSLPPS